MSSLRARRQEAITVALVFAVLCWTAAAFADFTGKVVAVKDGDTLAVLTGGVAVRVRLPGIDCPEKGQAFWQRAKQAASDLAFGKTVEVRDKGRDRYGRTAGEVILEDGRSLNRELVRAGPAWWYRQYAKEDADLARLEKEAREAKLGLWADARCFRIYFHEHLPKGLGVHEEAGCGYSIVKEPV